MTATEAAINEVRLAGLCDKKSDYAGMLGEAVIELLRVLGKQDHSGMSHGATVSIFKRAASGLPLSPLTDSPAEWMSTSDLGGSDWQNKRCFAVFSDNPKKTQRAYTIDGVAFENDNGTSFTSRQSRVEFDLPGYPPETRRIKESDWRASDALQAEFPHAFDD